MIFSAAYPYGSSQHRSPWGMRGAMLVLACACGWTVVDSLSSGWIRVGRGVWHRDVSRDDEPTHFWVAIIGNSVVCMGALGFLVATLVDRGLVAG